jgi:hypothetical protein
MVVKFPLFIQGPTRNDRLERQENGSMVEREQDIRPRKAIIKPAQNLIVEKNGQEETKEGIWRYSCYERMDDQITLIHHETSSRRPYSFSIIFLFASTVLQSHPTFSG